MKIKTTLLGIVLNKLAKSSILSFALWAILSFPLGEGWGGASSFAQNIGINSTGATPDASALLDINANPGNNKGLLIPRVALTVTTSNSPIGVGIALSLMVYNTATVNDVTPGYYYWSGTAWQRLQNILPVQSNDWTILGNAGTVDGTHFIGTTDNIPFNIRVNNVEAGRIDPNGPTFIGYQAGANNTATANTGIGYFVLSANTTGNLNTANGAMSLRYNTTGGSNTAMGYYSLMSNSTGSSNTASGARSLYANTTGLLNTAHGIDALRFNTTASQNTAIGAGALSTQSFSNGGVVWNSDNVAVGYNALYANQPTATWKGIENTAIGNYALQANTDGYKNTASGFQALYSNTTGSWNTASGYQAMLNNTTGSYNSAIGVWALRDNTWGSNNNAHGMYSLQNNTSGGDNNAFGTNSLTYNTTGNNNNAMGLQSLLNNTTGRYNTASGSFSLRNNTIGERNTASGMWALYTNTTGSYNTALGYDAYRLGIFSNSMALGATTLAISASNMVRIGSSAITSIGGQVGWTTLSDARVKNNVQENVSGLSFIKELRPVTYYFDIDKESEIMGTIDTNMWAGKYDIEKIQFSGFLAQEVDAAAQKAGYNFSGVDKSGTLWGLRYAEFVVPIVKAVQELNDSLKLNVESLTSENQELMVELQKQNEAQQNQNEELKKTIELLQKRIEAVEKTK